MGTRVAYALAIGVYETGRDGGGLSRTTVSGPAHLYRFDPTQLSRRISWDDALRCVSSLGGTR